MILWLWILIYGNLSLQIKRKENISTFRQKLWQFSSEFFIGSRSGIGKYLPVTFWQKFIDDKLSLWQWICREFYHKPSLQTSDSTKTWFFLFHISRGEFPIKQLEWRVEKRKLIGVHTKYIQSTDHTQSTSVLTFWEMPVEVEKRLDPTGSIFDPSLCCGRRLHLGEVSPSPLQLFVCSACFFCTVLAGHHLETRECSHACFAWIALLHCLLTSSALRTYRINS